MRRLGERRIGCTRIVIMILVFFALIFTAQSIGAQSKPYKQDLYLMYSPEYGLYKIGRSNNPQRRRREIERKSGVTVDIVKIYPYMGGYEPGLHQQFKYKNTIISNPDGSKGVEWFNMEQKDLNSLDSIMTHYTLMDKFDYVNMEYLPVATKDSPRKVFVNGEVFIRRETESAIGVFYHYTQLVTDDD